MLQIIGKWRAPSRYVITTSAISEDPPIPIN
jgi:hypothetical protein